MSVGGTDLAKSNLFMRDKIGTWAGGHYVTIGEVQHTHPIYAKFNRGGGDFFINKNWQ